MPYPADLVSSQRLLIKSSLTDYMPRLRKYDFFSIINAIMYVAKTGCQWYMLPKDFPPYRAVCHHWRSMCRRDVMNKLLKALVMGHRAMNGKSPESSACIQLRHIGVHSHGWTPGSGTNLLLTVRYTPPDEELREEPSYGCSNGYNMHGIVHASFLQIM